MFFRGVLKIQNLPNFKFSPIGSEGGGHQISNFSQIQKSPKHPGGGGDQENCGLFPLFVTFLAAQGTRVTQTDKQSDKVTLSFVGLCMTLYDFV